MGFMATAALRMWSSLGPGGVEGAGWIEKGLVLGEGSQAAELVDILWTWQK